MSYVHWCFDEEDGMRALQLVMSVQISCIPGDELEGEEEEDTGGVASGAAAEGEEACAVDGELARAVALLDCPEEEPEEEPPGESMSI